MELAITLFAESENLSLKGLLTFHPHFPSLVTGTVAEAAADVPARVNATGPARAGAKSAIPPTAPADTSAHVASSPGPHVGS